MPAITDREWANGTYEWDCRLMIDNSCDDHQFFRTASEALEWGVEATEIYLVCRTGKCGFSESLLTRHGLSWFFCDQNGRVVRRVPRRFHEEVRQALIGRIP